MNRRKAPNWDRAEIPLTCAWCKETKLVRARPGQTYCSQACRTAKARELPWHFSPRFWTAPRGAQVKA